MPEELGLLVFNMERGVHLEELGDFLQDCPGVRPLDVVLANELDDGCVRSGGRNTRGSWRSGSAGTTPTAWSSSSW